MKEEELKKLLIDELIKKEYEIKEEKNRIDVYASKGRWGRNISTIAFEVKGSNGNVNTGIGEAIKNRFEYGVKESYMVIPEISSIFRSICYDYRLREVFKKYPIGLIIYNTKFGVKYSTNAYGSSYIFERYKERDVGNIDDEEEKYFFESIESRGRLKREDMLGKPEIYIDGIRIE